MTVDVKRARIASLNIRRLPDRARSIQQRAQVDTGAVPARFLVQMPARYTDVADVRIRSADIEDGTVCGNQPRRLDVAAQIVQKATVQPQLRTGAGDDFLACQRDR